MSHQQPIRKHLYQKKSEAGDDIKKTNDDSQFKRIHDCNLLSVPNNHLRTPDSGDKYGAPIDLKFSSESEETYSFDEDDLTTPTGGPEKEPSARQVFRSLNMINNIARVLFPVCFLTFNIFYWSTLLVMISTKESYQLSIFFTSLQGSA